MRRWAPLYSLLMAVCITASVAAYWFRAPQSAAKLLRQARDAAARGDWESAVKAARRAAEQSPDSADAWLLVARGSVQLKRAADAVEAWSRVPADAPSAAEARRRAGETCLRELHHLGRAERLFREADRLSPDDPRIVDGLAQTLAVSGCWFELVPQLVRLIRLNACTNFHLDLLARGPELHVDPQLAPSRSQIAADDLLGRCALWRLTLEGGETDSIRDELPAMAQSHPECIPAQRLLGQFWLLAGDDERLEDWLQAASGLLHNDPDYWSIALAACQRWRDDAGALYAARELVRWNPNDVAACLTLGRGLSRLGDERLATVFLQRASRLEQYVAAVSRARRAPDGQALRQIVEIADELGLAWEAFGWCRLATRLNPRLEWATASLRRLSERAASLPDERTDPAVQLAAQLPADRFSAAGFQRRAASPLPTEVTSGFGPMAFRDDAEAVGLQFQYDNGGDWARDGLRRMFEFTGGGVGVIDFDGDGFPDLYFPQGGSFELRGRPMEVGDQLWRNRSGANLQNVTAAAGLSDFAFGQGVAVGDLDNDGFRDLLVLNIGGNVLWHNSGDGTFRLWSGFEPHAGEAWSLSAAIADLNGDGTPDAYLANYLAGGDLFTRICPDDRGVPRYTCQPLVFDAAPDQLLLGVGDGGFQDVTNESGIHRPEGRGMGVVVGRFSQGTLDIYVANDATANFHFVQSSTGTGPSNALRYHDEAFLRGTAVDGSGRAQASMGIAAGDADADGRTDLFLTNFEGETNALYLQHMEGQFSERSQEFGLAAPSRGMLGFGTQFLDADLDGFPDLFVANGHVNDRRPSGGPFQMRPQMFRNRQGQAFQEVAAEEAGPYFAKEYLGRGAAVLDWNGDGLPDLAVSHLDRPAALLTNLASRHGHWVKVRCVGTRAARDAIGTQVRVLESRRPIMAPLTAGDGYESSNERVVFIGLGDWRLPEVTLEVHWPAAAEPQRLRVPINRETVIIEGQSATWPLPPKEQSNVPPLAP